MRNNTENVIVIGGGASGLYLASLSKEIIILEKNESVGIKLLSTGGGACNITSDEPTYSLIKNFPDKKNFVGKTLSYHSNNEIINHFDNLGLSTFTREDGKVFPTSKKSKDVLNALLSKGNKIITNTKVLNIKKEDGIFVIETENGTFFSKALVIATGGYTYPKTGSTGDGYHFAKQLGHKIITPKPALSPIELNIDVLSIEGISLENATLIHNKKKYIGPLLFTKRGISGPVALNLSREINKGDSLVIKFAEIDKDEIRSNQTVKNSVKNLTGLQNRLIEYLFPFSHKISNQISNKELNEIVDKITNFRVIAQTEKEVPFAMVTRGGVDVNEINSETFESKKVDNLYLIGEVTDVDGFTGGYNLTYAFSSAASCFKDLKRKHFLS